MAGRLRRAQGPPPRAGATALPSPAAARALARFAPSSRSLAVGVALLALGVGAYFVARTSSAFAIDRIEVAGASPEVRRQVHRAAAPFLGTNLLALDGAGLERRIEALPTIVSAGYDRAFPHVLKVRVLPERPVAVVHRGTETWLASARGRVIERIPNGTRAALPRIWVKRAAPVAAGGFLAAGAGGIAVRSAALASRFPARVATVSLAHDELVFRLRSGLVLRLGEPTDVRLKLAIARRALHALPAGTTYLDVSLPGRPVAGADSRLSGRG